MPATKTVEVWAIQHDGEPRAQYLRRTFRGEPVWTPDLRAARLFRSMGSARNQLAYLYEAYRGDIRYVRVHLSVQED